MSIPTWAYVGSSVLNFVNNLAANQQNAENVLRTNSQNAALARDANQWSIQQWNRENAYNTPVNQMKRLQDAGINPALAFSNGAFNQAATSPNVQMPSPMRSPNVEPYYVDPLAAAQIDVMDAQADAIRNNTQRENEYQQYRIALNESQQVQLNNLANLLKEEGLTEEYKRYNLDSETDLNRVRQSIFGLDLDKQQRTLESEVTRILNEGYMTQQNADNIVRVLNKEYEILMQKLENMRYDAKLSDAQRAYYWELWHYYEFKVGDRMDALTRYYNGMSSYYEHKIPWVNFREFTTGVKDITLGFKNVTDGIMNIYTKGTTGKMESFKPRFDMEKPLQPGQFKKGGRVYTYQ